MQTHTVLDYATVEELVRTTLQDLLAEKAVQSAAPAAIPEATASLLGGESGLDSLGLVTLVVDLEQQLEHDYGVSLTLADDRAMSRKNSPFRSRKALTDHICSLLAEGLP